MTYQSGFFYFSLSCCVSRRRAAYGEFKVFLTANCDVVVVGAQICAGSMSFVWLIDFFICFSCSCANISFFLLRSIKSAFVAGFLLKVKLKICLSVCLTIWITVLVWVKKKEEQVSLNDVTKFNPLQVSKRLFPKVETICLSRWKLTAKKVVKVVVVKEYPTQDWMWN